MSPKTVGTVDFLTFAKFHVCLTKLTERGFSLFTVTMYYSCDGFYKMMNLGCVRLILFDGC
jgi:hypothetical protein